MGCAAAAEYRGVGAARPKRLRRDPLYAARVAYCAPRGIPLDAFLAWPVESQAAALAWQEQQESRCPGCGTHAEEWVRGKPDPRHWHPKVCRGCQVKERAIDELRADEDHARGLGLVAVDGPASTCPECAG